MNCRLIKHRPYRTPILREDQFSVGGLLNLELLVGKQPRHSHSGLSILPQGRQASFNKNLRY
jgi:hypothetical protein